jgi:hypothetical protein
MPLPIDDAGLPQNPLPVDTEQTGGVPVSPTVASDRAFKARYGLSDLPNTSYDQIYQSMVSGQENDLRQKKAIEVDYQKAIAKQQAISNFARNNPDQAMDRDSFQALSNKLDQMSKPTDGNSVYEENFARQAVSNNLYSTMDANRGSSLERAATVIGPDNFNKVTDVADEVVAKREFLLKQAQDSQSAAEGRSTLDKILDIAKGIDPTYDSRKFGALFAPRGLGSELERQASEDLSLPFGEFKERVTKKLDYLRRDNPDLANVYVNHLLGASTSDVFLENTFHAVNLLTIGQLGKIGLDVGIAAAKGLGIGAAKTVATEAAATEVKEAVKSVVKGVTGKTVDKPTIIAAAGDVGEAAVQKASSNLIKSFKGLSTPEQAAVEAMPKVFRIEAQSIADNPGSLARDVVNRIQEGYTNMVDNIVDRIQNRVVTERIPGFLATEQSIREYKDRIKDLYPGLRNSILDISDPVHNVATNTYTLDLAVGKPGGELFFNPMQARTYAKNQGLTDFKLERQGAGYYLRLTKPLNETDDIVRDGLIKTGITDSRNSFYHNFTSWLKTSENVQSTAASANRKTATYGPSSLISLAEEEAKAIGKLMRGSRLKSLVGKKNLWEDWERIVKASRDMVDPETGKPGYFFKNPADLEKTYLQQLKRLPEPAEQEAYWAYSRYMELDRTLRNMSVYRNKTRVGTEQHTLSYTDAASNVKKATFDGVVRDHIPGGEETMFIQGVPGFKKEITRTNGLSNTEKQKLKDALLDGKVRVIEIYDPETRPLAGFSKVTDQRIRYVITSVDKVDTKAIPWEQIPRRGGGHFDYAYDNWIKQARIRPEKVSGKFHHWYEGDTTVMPVAIRKMGNDVANIMNEARILYKGKNEAAARALVESKLDMEWSQFKGWFQPGKSPEGLKVPPRLDINEPFQVVPNNRSIVDMDKSLELRYPGTFKDGTKSGSLARQYQVAYTSERDAINMQTYKDIGKKGEPAYSIQPAELVDPIPSMNRALARITQSAYMDDYKIFAVEHWLQEAQNHLKTRSPGVNEIRYAPFWHFHNPEWKPGTPVDVKSRLMAQRWQIEKLVGTSSDSDAVLHSISQRIADSAYETLGPKLGTKLDPDWMLSKLRDPFRFARNITFHTTMGLFALPTLWTQLQTHFVIGSIAGFDKAGQGAAASLLHVYSRFNRNPEILEHLDGIASKMGFKKGEFLEASQGLENSGFGNVGGEYQNINNLLTPQLVKGYANKILDAGTIFFRMGEGNVRHSAWFVAYKEYREAFPHGALTNSDWTKILNRADTLNVNMSRASQSMMNTGVLSVTTQFLTYQMRLAELFFSNRLAPEWKSLTNDQMNHVRARLLLSNLALYGAPMSTGVVGLPFYDYLRQKAIENGYVMGDQYLSSVFMEGIPSVALAMISGGGDMAKGNWYNVGDKLGSQGFEFLRDFLRGDKPMYQLLGGAAFTKFSNAYESIKPVFTFAASAFRDDDKYFPFRAEDLLNVAKEANTINIIHRSIVAAQTAKWMSKKGQFLTDEISPWNAAFLAVTGFQPQQSIDLQAFYASNKDQEEAQKEGLKMFLVQGRRALMAVESNDKSAYTDYMTRATNWLRISGYPEEKWPTAWSILEDENKAATDKIPWDWAFKKPIADADRASRYDWYRRAKEVDDKRKGNE